MPSCILQRACRRALDCFRLRVLRYGDRSLRLACRSSKSVGGRNDGWGRRINFLTLYAFFTNSDLRFIAPMPSILQAML
jgi:hypothetical protein